VATKNFILMTLRVRLIVMLILIVIQQAPEMKRPAAATGLCSILSRCCAICKCTVNTRVIQKVCIWTGLFIVGELTGFTVHPLWD